MMANHSAPDARHLQFGSDAGLVKITREAQQHAGMAKDINLILSQAEPRIDGDSYLNDLLAEMDNS